MFPQNIFPKKFEKKTQKLICGVKKRIFLLNQIENPCVQLKLLMLVSFAQGFWKFVRGLYIWHHIILVFPTSSIHIFLFIIYMVYTVEKLMNNILCIAFKNGTFLIKFISFWWFMFDKHSKWFSTYSTQKCYFYFSQVRVGQSVGQHLFNQRWHLTASNQLNQIEPM